MSDILPIILYTSAAVVFVIILLLFIANKLDKTEGFRKNIWSVNGGYYEIPDMTNCRVFQKGVLSDLFSYAAPEDKGKYLRFADLRCKKPKDDPLADELCPARDFRVNMMDKGVEMRSVKNYTGLPFTAYDLNPWDSN